MKVQIGDKIYDGEKEQITIILDDTDKKLINTMPSTAYKYSHFPKDITEEIKIPHTESIATCDIGIEVAKDFFNWCDQYHPLKLAWNTWENNKDENSESYPYNYFKEIATNKINELVKSYIR